MTDLDDDMYDYISDGGDDADADYENNNNNDDDEYGLANQEPPQQQYYTILNEEDIRKRQEDDVTTVSTVLSVSKAWASILLHNFHWSVNRVHDAWFADADSVRQTVGLLFEKSAVVPKNDQQIVLITCGICFEDCSCDEISTAACGHPYCKTCWEGYITTSINNGPGCLTLRCPDPDCKAAVGQDLIDVFVASDEDSRNKYYRYQVRSYIEHNKKTKWCPAPGCDFAVEFVVGSECYDITCLCSHSFCWNCAEETHRPVDCATVLKWMIKNSCESANMEWVLAFTKPCPKCKRPIEKSQGCNHMTCSKPCGFHFCWLCLGDSTHKEKPCNRYSKTRNGGAENEGERRRKMAKKSLERYMHYYERWATNEKSRKKAIEDLNQMQNVHIKNLSDTLCQTEKLLEFITDAWLQIIECRRVLKWTYGYGYYIPEHERAKKDFFEYVQGEAETGLERLHQCAEKELQQFLSPKGPSDRFYEFRSKLTGLTAVTKTYFENLVRALENGLSDVDSPPTRGARGK